MRQKNIILVLAVTALLAALILRPRPPDAVVRSPRVPVRAPSIQSTPSTPSNPSRTAEALAAALNHAAQQGTAAAEQLVAALTAEYPADERALHGYLIFALLAAGDHERAAALAAESEPADRIDHLTGVYAAWARHEPEIAVDAALMLDDPARQRAAFQAAISGWARHDPSRLAECASHFPPGPERKLALSIALHAWAATNPIAASQWFELHATVLEGVSRTVLAGN